jgi:hypothetical protein
MVETLPVARGDRPSSVDVEPHHLGNRLAGPGAVRSEQPQRGAASTRSGEVDATRGGAGAT